MLTHFSLFTGIGGIDLAAEWAGFTTVGQCEWADYPTKVLEKHWPDVPRWRDIRDVTAESVMARKVGAITLISGGFPCQPFSLAGYRRGAADDRYLWPEMLRVISVLRPSWIVAENVAGLASMALEYLPAKVESRAITRSSDYDVYEAILTRQEIMFLDTVCKSLESENYEVQPLIIPACAVNAPHKRDRVWIVANSECSQWRPGESSGYESNRENAGWKEASGGIGASSADGGNWFMGNADRKGRTRSNGIQESTITAESGEDVADTEICGQRPGLCQDKQIGKRRGRSGDICSKDVEDSISGSDRAKIERKKIKWPETIGPTSRISGSSWWATEPDVGRVANGIPDRVDRLKCLGNAVVPYQVFPILQAIAEIENGMV